MKKIKRKLKQKKTKKKTKKKNKKKPNQKARAACAQTNKKKTKKIRMLAPAKIKITRTKDLHPSLLDMSQLCFYYTNPLNSMYKFSYNFI